MTQSRFCNTKNKKSYKLRGHMIHNRLLMADGVCLDNDENLQYTVGLFIHTKNKSNSNAVTCRQSHAAVQ